MLLPDNNTELSLERLVPPDEETTDASFGSKLKAAFQTENTVGAFLSNGVNLSDFNSSYNPWEDLTEAERLDKKFVDTSMEANSADDIEQLRKQRAKEVENRNKLTGMDGFIATFAAGAFDPVNLIPVGGTAYKTYRTGGAILKGAAVTGAVASGAVGVQEALLHSQQVERTLGESAVNITAAMFLASVLGGVSSYYSKANYAKLAEETERFLNEPSIQWKDNANGESVSHRSAGASASQEDIKIKGKTAEALIKASAFDPLSRTLTSKSQSAKQFLVELAENPIDVEGYTGQAIESLIKVRRDALLYRGIKGNRDAHNDYLKEVGSSNIVSHLKKDVLSLRQFNELVAKEIRNPETTSPHVKKAADSWLKEVYEPQLKAIQEARLLPEGVEVTTAKRYLNRVWNKEKIAGRLPEFKQIVSRWLTHRGTEADQADGIASEIAGRIMSSNDGMLPYDYQYGGKIKSGGGAGMKGAFKARVFDIDDTLIDEFLDNDIEKIAGRYLRQTSPDIEIMKRFSDEKSTPEEVLSFRHQKKDIEQEYVALMERASTAKERIKIKKEKDAVTRDLNGIVDRIRGVYGAPDPNNIFHRMAQSARNMNFLRFMGGVTVSSFPDMARLVMAEGMSKAFSTSFRHLSKGLKKIPRPTADDVHWHGIGTDAYTGGRLEVISDINDYALGGTKFERGLQSMANNFGQINLMNQWTGGMKTIHAIAMQSSVMDVLSKGKLDPRLKRLGITEPDAKQIYQQVKKHGYKEKGAWVYNAKNWDDPELAMQWGAALKKESDRVIVVPGQERPLFMSSELGKTFMQFKSFMMSATQRVMIAGVQGQDAHMIQGALAMVSMGAMTYVIKGWESGRELDLSLENLIMEGIDRSGALGIFMEINNTMEKLSGNHFGLRALTDVSSPSSRYASRSIVESLLGPTFGSLLDNSVRVANAVSDKNDWKDSDTRAVRRLLPYQNLTGFRKAVDKLENLAGD